jgi:site-specific recombinase XerD
MNTLALVPREEGAPATLDWLQEAVLASVTSPHSKRNYAKAFANVGKYLAAASQPLARETLFRYREHRLERGLSPLTINVQLSAVRKLVAEAQRHGIIDSETAASIIDVPNVRQQGTRLGNWLNRSQAKELLAVPDRERMIGNRDHAILALLLGCGLRRLRRRHRRRREQAPLQRQVIQIGR